jgi:DNA-directed DNA polymerase III PolC
MENRAVVKWGERKPIMLLSELESLQGQLVLCSSCLIGGVMKLLSPKHGTPRPDLSEQFYLRLRELAGPGQFFVELFPHKLTHDWVRPEKDESGKITKPGYFKQHECIPGVADGDLQRHANEFVLHLARKYGDPILISLDSHFANPADKAIQNAKINNGVENWVFSNSYHIYTSDECAEVLKHTLKVSDRDIEEWVDNSYRFASLFDDFRLTTAKDRWVLEPLPEDWRERIMAAIERYGRMDWANDVMVGRLTMELETLTKNGRANLVAYLLPLVDIANYCRDHGIMMNVRGSAGGSLLLYLLGISVVNPLKHDLSFGRFLTLGRVKAGTLPDVDVDIATGGRDEVIGYLSERYGDRICRISTDMQMKLKTAIKDAERSEYGAVSQKTEKMTRRLPNQPQGVEGHEYVFGKTDKEGHHTPGILEQDQELREYSERNQSVWALVTAMLGIKRQKGTHACGFLLADRPVQEYIPITKVGDDLVTAYSPKSVEMVGLVKYDFLGLNTLRDIQVCLELIKQHRGIAVDPWHLPHDPECFESLSNGETESVFQFDTPTVRPYVRAIKPKSIEDLASITSLCRPGCLDAPTEDGRTLAQVYVARAQGERVQYVHPDLEPILKETYGVQLYQEQSMRIFRDLAGYSDEQAEVVRRGIGKKEEKVLKSCMADLKAGCINRGWTEQQVDLLISQIMASARYSFNKSHAISYSYVAYACMYLKRHYPAEWWTAVLRNAHPDDVREKGYGRAVRDVLEMPDMNGPAFLFEHENNKIRAPMILLDGVGPTACKGIQAARTSGPFTSMQDFWERTRGQSVNTKVVQNLIIAGAFNQLHSHASTRTLLEDHYYLGRVSGLKAGRDKTGEELYRAAKTYQELNPEEALKNVEYLRLTDMQLKKLSLDLLPIARIDVHEIFRPQLEKYLYYDQATPYMLIGKQRTEVARNLIDVGSHYRSFVKKNLPLIFCGLVQNGKDFTYSDKRSGLPVTAHKFELLNDGEAIECVLWPNKYQELGKPVGAGPLMCLGNIKEGREPGKYQMFVNLFQELSG